METRKRKATKSAAGIGIGAALAIVITQGMAAAGINLGEEIVGPLGVVLGAIVQEVRHYIGADHA